MQNIGHFLTQLRRGLNNQDFFHGINASKLNSAPGANIFNGETPVCFGLNDLVKTKFGKKPKSMPILPQG
jgi:hypothetical protein